METRDTQIIARAAAQRLHQGLPIVDLLDLYPWLPNVVDAQGRTLLHVAIHYGRPDAINELLTRAGINGHSWL